MVGALMLGGTIQATALPWPSSMSYRDCVSLGFAAGQVATNRDRQKSPSLSLAGLGVTPDVSQRVQQVGEELVAEIYASTKSGASLSQHYLLACMKRYDVHPPRPPVISHRCVEERIGERIYRDCTSTPRY